MIPGYGLHHTYQGAIIGTRKSLMPLLKSYKWYAGLAVWFLSFQDRIDDAETAYKLALDERLHMQNLPQATWFKLSKLYNLDAEAYGATTGRTITIRKHAHDFVIP